MSKLKIDAPRAWGGAAQAAMFDSHLDEDWDFWCRVVRDSTWRHIMAVILPRINAPIDKRDKEMLALRAHLAKQKGKRK